jgi:putative intracellular protease/amidase
MNKFTNSAPNPAFAGYNSNKEPFANTRILRRFACPASRKATRPSSPKSCPTKPAVYVANRSQSVSQARRAPQPELGEFGRTTRTNCLTTLWAALILGAVSLVDQTASGQEPGSTPAVEPLKPPTSGRINVAFIISDGADVMDIAGPWEVFSDAMLTSKGQPWHAADGEDMVMPFAVYTVSDSLKPVDAGGLTIVPNYTFDTAPKPQVIVIPAQGGRTEAQKAWLLKNSGQADITMSVCTGASMLAAYGLLDGKTATTHHLYQQAMQKKYQGVQFISGTRFVEHGKVATAGGLTSGMDLALHVVERYYGREVAEVTADYLEYHSDLWKNPEYGQVKPVTASK